jgi:hypothetical protein
MFIPFLIPVAASAMALGVYKLSALSVCVTVLSLALKSVSLLALAAALYALAMSLKGRRYR